MSQDKHEYDGIIELDNPLPSWWLFTFLATIIFAAIYFIHYTFGGAQTQGQELEIAMKALPQAHEKTWSEDELTGPFGLVTNISSGKALFTAKCAPCHGAEGQGVIGPNLADHFWLHGKGRRHDILSVIRQGVVANGMPSWTGMMSDDEIIHVASFVYSLKSSHPSNPKPPQGNEVPE